MAKVVGNVGLPTLSLNDAAGDGGCFLFDGACTGSDGFCGLIDCGCTPAEKKPAEDVPPQEG